MAVIKSDPMGIKKIFYNEKGIIIGNEAELKDKFDEIQTKDISLSKLNEYLTYFYVPAPYTLIKGLYKIPPAHKLITKDNRIWELEEYFTLHSKNNTELNIEDLVNIIESKLKKYLKKVVEGSKSIGLFLSGGLDSSGILALLSNIGCKNIKTYTIGFKDSELLDEREEASRIAEYFGTKHTEIIIDGTWSLFKFEELIKYMPDLFGSPVFLLVDAVLERMKGEVDTILAGDGGDEVFGSYPRYRAFKWASQYLKMPKFIRKSFQKSLNLVPDFEKTSYLIKRAKKFALGMSNNPAEMALNWITYYSSEMKKRLFTNEVLAQINLDEAKNYYYENFNRYPDLPILQRANYCDLKGSIPFNELTYVQTIARHYNLDITYVYLEPSLVKFMFNIPFNIKMKGNKPRVLFKNILKDKLPDWVLNQKKIGFYPPIFIWLKKDFKPVMEDLLSKDSVRKRDLFNYEYIERMKSDFYSGKRDWSLHLWGLLILEKWMRVFIDN
jgi:asparagine synthase (glutamine-hydrolysing)